MKIAIAGKGGTGKPTRAALLVGRFREKGPSPLLAIDADPNANLHLLLGIKYEKSISDIRDSVRHGTPPAGMTKSQYFALAAEEALVENRGFDFIAMGHPEGKDCYCSVNNILRSFLENMEKRYPLIIIDNEAGLEHLSRQSNGRVDCMIFVAENTNVSLTAVKNGLEISGKLKLEIGKTGLVLNRTDTIRSEAENLGIPVLAALPEDPAIRSASEKGEPVGNKVSPAVLEKIDKIIAQLQ